MRLEDLRAGLWQWFTEGVAENATAGGTRICIQAPAGVRLSIPMEWNQAKRLSDILGEPVWMLDGLGNEVRRYTPVQVKYPT